ncbi:sigma-54 interaction domain-containing protein [Youngiibacter multivorans]|uniref:Transcriptional regulator with PAS, ATPase and Fis domain n=1 Tax=Youngiibacter multivorans TaxID=937251 RepID=A0ABS4G1R6_9CLOT|nr:sigma 54-interacting transcriptional regulator [Youngiibacter multivorans]MBP1918290.1 transcriptional regulator with PAS, ATPase and Fis domain [Youngiibacter multivorans]
MDRYSSWLDPDNLSQEMMEYYANEALESVGSVAIIDKDFRMVYINDKYADSLGIDRLKSLGRPVSEVIDNTNMTNVAKTGHPELGVIYSRNGVNFVINKFPIMKNGEFMGIVGISTFQDNDKLISLKLRLDNLVKELNYYKDKSKKQNAAKYSIDDIISQNDTMLKLKLLVHKMASTKSTVLISGESGTGKELFAHALHSLSRRSGMPFQRINCSTIPENLIESELFGYEKGTFTGASKDGKLGEFEVANGGTMMMDEIDSLPLSMQAKLLRVLQEKEIRRIGGKETIDIDVRMIFTTNKDLLSMVRSGQFREDLYYRINVMNISIPPLRERKEDIPYIIERFIQKYNREMGMRVTGISPEALDLLMGYEWPGNIRELENYVERAFIYSTGGMLGLEHFDFLEKLPAADSIEGHEKPIFEETKLRDMVARVEREAISEAMSRFDGNKKRAAESLGVDRSVFYEKLRRYGIG